MYITEYLVATTLRTPRYFTECQKKKRTAVHNSEVDESYHKKLICLHGLGVKSVLYTHKVDTDVVNSMAI